MIFLAVMLIFISVYEIRVLLKEKKTKETVVFVCLTVITFFTGLIYINNPWFDKGIMGTIMDVIGIKY